ncbi:hypothetical protein Lal_00032720 [Lupinus albus]|nr:hypothetical protein Lal_00032720 [Lupinus albus]
MARRLEQKNKGEGNKEGILLIYKERRDSSNSWHDDPCERTPKDRRTPFLAVQTYLSTIQRRPEILGKGGRQDGKTNHTQFSARPTRHEDKPHTINHPISKPVQ